MMTIGGIPHLLMVLASIIIAVVLIVIVSKVGMRAQNIIITSCIAICVFGIFFLHGTHYFTKFDILNLLKQMLQVCNFNFILLPLCLFKRNELARQYLFFFSMPAALSTFVAYPSDVEGSMWYSVVCLTFWINHFLIVIIPLLMIATRRFKPRIDYVWKVATCVLFYFTMAFVGNYALNGFTFDSMENNYSYTMDSGSIMILQPLYKLIPIPFVYLLPLLPLVIGLFYLGALAFKKYRTNEDYGFGFTLKKKSTQ